MKKALVCFAIMLPCIVFAQITEEWIATYEDGAWHPHMAIDDMENVYIAGSYVYLDTIYDSLVFLKDYVAIKYNATGEEQWVVFYDGPAGLDDWATDIAVDGAGNVYVTGTCRADTFLRHFHWTTVKYSPLGNEQWIKTFEGFGVEETYARCMELDSEGNIFIAGRSNKKEGETLDYDFTLVKYDSAGNELWSTSYVDPKSYREDIYAMAVDDSDNVYITGMNSSDGNGWDWLTVKYDNDGEEQWAVRYDGGSTVSYLNSDIPSDMTVDRFGNVYVTGRKQKEMLDNQNDCLTIKYSSYGVEQWQAIFDADSGKFGGDQGYSVDLDDEGNVYVFGRTEIAEHDFNFFTLRYSPQGEQQWIRYYHGTGNNFNRSRSLVVDDSGYIYITGETKQNYYDYCTIKYNQDGTEMWRMTYDGGTGGWDDAQVVMLDSGNNVYVTGTTAQGYTTIKYSQGPGIAEASPDVSGHRLEVTQLTPEPTISYTLSVSTHVSLKLYDVTGQLVKTLVSGSQSAGTHTIRWPVTHPKTPSGVYFVRLETSNRSATAKLVVAR